MAIKKSFSSMLKDFLLTYPPKGMGLPCTWPSCIQRYTFDHLDILDTIIMTKSPLCHPIIKINKEDMAQRSIFHFDRWKLHHLHRACFSLNILNSLSLRLCHRQRYHDRRNRQKSPQHDTSRFQYAPSRTRKCNLHFRHMQNGQCPYKNKAHRAESGTRRKSRCCDHDKIIKSS